VPTTAAKSDLVDVLAITAYPVLLSAEIAVSLLVACRPDIGPPSARIGARCLRWSRGLCGHGPVGVAVVRATTPWLWVDSPTGIAAVAVGEEAVTFACPCWYWLTFAAAAFPLIASFVVADSAFVVRPTSHGCH